MTPFGEDAAASLPGPEWIAGKRKEAEQRLASSVMPTGEEEVWRYAPLDDLDLSAFSLVTEPATIDATALLAEFPDRSGAAVLSDGHLVHIEGDAVSRLLDAETPGSFASVLDEPTDIFADMNTAYAADPICITVKPGKDIPTPIVIINMVTTPGAAVFPRLVVDAGADSSVSVLDITRSADVAAFIAPVVELANADAARLTYLNVQELGPQVWQIANQISSVGSQGSLAADCAAFGGAYARLRADCRLVGRGANGHLGAVYFGDGDQTLDFRTFQDHIGPDTTSDLLFKGVLDHTSRSVYSGLIRVGKDARGTNAFQTNRNIKLSEHAWAESVPNLEIETDDVRCSHASTVGPIDEEQRFYLQSRGVPAAVADRLIVAGFFNEVIDGLSFPAVAADLRSQIAAKLDASALGAATAGAGA